MLDGAVLTESPAACATFIRLSDSSYTGTKSERRNGPKAKRHRARTIPVHENLVALLQRLKSTRSGSHYYHLPADHARVQLNKLQRTRPQTAAAMSPGQTLSF